MTDPSRTALAAIEIVSACVWVGSMVCLAVVAGTARRVLDPGAQVSFFRAVGRRYALVGTGSLLVAIGAGIWLLWPPGHWSAVVDAAVALAGFLAVASAAGMAQARAMTRLRRASIESPGDHLARRAVARGRRVATALRGAMALTTAALVVLAAQMLAG